MLSTEYLETVNCALCGEDVAATPILYDRDLPAWVEDNWGDDA